MKSSLRYVQPIEDSGTRWCSISGGIVRHPPLPYRCTRLKRRRSALHGSTRSSISRLARTSEYLAPSQHRPGLPETYIDLLGLGKLQQREDGHAPGWLWLCVSPTLPSLPEENVPVPLAISVSLEYIKASNPGRSSDRSCDLPGSLRRFSYV